MRLLTISRIVYQSLYPWRKWLLLLTAFIVNSSSASSGAPQLGVGPHVSLPKQCWIDDKLALLQVTIAVISSWMQWPTHVQKTELHGTPSYPLSFQFLLCDISKALQGVVYVQDINVLFMDKHSAVTSPQYFEQLWVSELTAVHCKKRLLWLMMRIGPMHEGNFSHSCPGVERWSPHISMALPGFIWCFEREGQGGYLLVYGSLFVRFHEIFLEVERLKIISGNSFRSLHFTLTSSDPASQFLKI